MFGQDGDSDVTGNDESEPVVFVVLESKQANPDCEPLWFSSAIIILFHTVLKVLKRYYDSLWRSFPQDPNIVRERCRTDLTPTKPLPLDHEVGLDFQVRNKSILDHLITTFVLSNGTCSPFSFCMVLNTIIGKNDITRNLERGR